MAQTGYTPIILYHSTTAAAAPTSGNLNNGELALNIQDEKLYFKNAGGTVKLLASSAGAAGDVVGPASATDNAIVRFDGTTGKLVQNSVVTIADSTGDISGVGQLNATTLDATNIEVTNIKAKDGTASATIANSTGVMTIGSSVLTTADINGGTIDGTAIGGSTPAAGAFTTLSASGLSVLNSAASLLRATINASNASAQQVDIAFTNSGGSTYIGQDAAGNSFIDARGALNNINFGYSGAVVTSIGTTGLTMASGMSIRGSNNLTLNATTGNSVIAQVNNATVGAFSSTGLSVTGTLSSTGNFTVNTDRVVLTASAPANSLYLNGSGNLGLGTASPSTKLHLQDNSAVYIQMTDVGDGASRVGQNGTALTFGVDGADGSTERMRIDSSGNVGIGTTTNTNSSRVYIAQAGNLRMLQLTSSNVDSSVGIGLTNDARAWSVGVRGDQSDAFNIRDITASADRLNIDSSGNVGIGTSSPAASLSVVKQTTALSGTGNAYGLYMYPTSSGLTYIDAITGSTGNTSLGFRTYNNGTYNEMRMDSSGNVGIGTTSPDALLTVNTIASFGDGAVTTPSIAHKGDLNTGFWFPAADTIAASTGGSERIRIDSSGNLLVGTTDSASTTGVGLKQIYNATVPYIITVVNDSIGSNYYLLYNTNATNNGYRFYVQANGGVANYSGNNTNLSDERTKENIELASSYLNKICAIPVKTFNYKDEPVGEQKTLGVIAQDVEAVAPEFVNNDGFGETKEGEIPFKSVYTTDLMFALMKSIQELKAELDTAKARIAALEAK